MIYQTNIRNKFSDRFDGTDRAFAIAGANDTDANSATTILTTPGFKGNEHPRECLNFWYNIKVRIYIFMYPHRDYSN